MNYYNNSMFHLYLFKRTFIVVDTKQNEISSDFAVFFLAFEMKVRKKIK